MMTKPIEVFRMPTPGGVLGRSSSITNSFVNAIVPSRMPSDGEVAEALSILGMTADDFRCSYCGDKATEWDHFRPLIAAQQPTGYISEIQNLVPACGKCNQSKGNSHWRTWMTGTAKLCPNNRRIADLHDRIARLERFESWREATKLNIAELVGAELWTQYRANWSQLLESMRVSQQLAVEVRSRLSERIAEVSRSAPPVGDSAAASELRLAQKAKIAIRRAEAPAIATMPPDERREVVSRIRQWAMKPHLNVHKIIGLVVRSTTGVSFDQLVRDVERVTGSRNGYGALRSLMTTKGNAYGRVFEEVDGVVRLHPDVQREVRAIRWS